jgi:hypothetical protein
MNACGLGIDICLFLGKNKVDMQFMVFFTESADVTGLCLFSLFTDATMLINAAC